MRALRNALGDRVLVVTDGGSILDVLTADQARALARQLFSLADLAEARDKDLTKKGTDT